MTAVPRTLTIDSRDALALATFWSALVERPIDPGAHAGFASIGLWQEGLALLFLGVPEAKATKNRVHLDLGCDDLDAEVERCLRLGARRLGAHAEWGVSWVVLADPEGNEFCLCGPPPARAQATPGG